MFDEAQSCIIFQEAGHGNAAQIGNYNRDPDNHYHIYYGPHTHPYYSYCPIDHTVEYITVLAMYQDMELGVLVSRHQLVIYQYTELDFTEKR